MTIARTSVAVTLALATAIAAQAQDSALGIRAPRSPALDGQRAISALVSPPPSGSSYHQVPFGQSVPNGRSRLVLEYTTSQENWSPRRSIVATVTASGSTLRATVILPQGQLLPANLPLPESARHFDPAYYRNPAKIAHGQQVLYRWRREDGSQARTGDVHEFVMPHPLVIAVMGDSYGSGEGAPQRESTFLGEVRWADLDSHRSNHSGQRQAVARFSRLHPELWVEFKHTGISGATLSTSGASGYLTDYTGERELKVVPIPLSAAPPVVIWWPVPMRPNVRAEAQLTQVENWLAENAYDRTHALVIAGGGNDAGFGETVRGALIGSLRLDFGNTLRKFRENIGVLRQTAEADFKPALEEVIRPLHILWTTYPDLTQDGNATPGGIQVSPSLNAGLMLMDLAVGGDDMENARILLREELNPAVRSICREIMTGCRVVEVEDAAAGRGINTDAETRWFNTFTDAQDRVQGAVDGSVHPNEAGQELFVGPVLEQLEALYNPRTGSEYRRMRSEQMAEAREAAKEKAREKAIARAQAKQRRKVLRSAENPAVARVRDLEPRVRPVLERQRQVSTLAARRQATAKNAKRRALHDMYQSQLQSRVPLRLALPATERVAAARDVLTRAGRQQERTELESTVNRLRELKSIDPRILRDAIERERAKAKP